MWRLDTSDGSWAVKVPFHQSGEGDEKCIRVPACAIPVERCGTVYEVAAWFELRCCGECRDKDSHLAVSGFEKLGVYQFV